jgi:hypothetical protein
VHSVKVALSDGMLAEGSDAAVVAHSTGSFAAGVAASEHLASASGSVTIASETEGVASALVLVSGSFAVA